ncbi:hypothetical protein Q4R94_22795, partial [Morganella morganii]
RVPFSRLIKSCNFNRIELKSKEIKKLNNRIARHGKLDSIIDAINLDKVNSQKKFSSIAEINAEQFNKFKELTVIVKNIKNIEQNELVHYVKNIAIPLFNDVNTD